MSLLLVLTSLGTGQWRWWKRHRPLVGGTSLHLLPILLPAAYGPEVMPQRECSLNKYYKMLLNDLPITTCFRSNSPNATLLSRHGSCIIIYTRRIVYHYGTYDIPNDLVNTRPISQAQIKTCTV